MLIIAQPFPTFLWLPSDRLYITVCQYSHRHLPPPAPGFTFISLCVFPLTVPPSSLRFLGSAGMSPQLQSTNQFPSESVTSYFICSLPISSAPPPIFSQFDINLTCFIFPCIPGPFFFLANASFDNCTFKSDQSHTHFNTLLLRLVFHFGEGKRQKLTYTLPCVCF